MSNTRNGFLTYSEGVNDDVNKFVWSGLGWNPATPVVEILRDFGRYFIGYQFRRRLRAGPVGAGAQLGGTAGHQHGRGHHAAAVPGDGAGRDSPQVLENWRFQQALYRAYYDYYDRARLIYETGLENLALDQLRRAPKTGSLLAMDEAARILNRALLEPPAQWARARVFEMAEAMFQSIRAQVSVPRYKAEAPERGANLDMIDMPMNNRGWLMARFAEIRKVVG